MKFSVVTDVSLLSLGNERLSFRPSDDGLHTCVVTDTVRPDNQSILR
jgi:hypothetical protein